MAYAEVGSQAGAPLGPWHRSETGSQAAEELEVERLAKCADYRFRIAAVTTRGLEGEVSDLGSIWYIERH